MKDKGIITAITDTAKDLNFHKSFFKKLEDLKTTSGAKGKGKVMDHKSRLIAVAGKLVKGSCLNSLRDSVDRQRSISCSRLALMLGEIERSLKDDARELRDIVDDIRKIRFK